MRLFASIASLFAGLFWLCADDTTDKRPPWDAVKLVSFNRGDASDRSWLAQSPTVGSGATFPDGYRTGDFDGTTNGTISWPDATDLEALPLTVCCWVRIDSYTGLRAIVHKMDQSTSYRGWALFYSPGLASRGLVWHQVDSADTSVSNPEFRNGYAPVGNLTAGTWYHVAATSDAFTNPPVLYINGVSQSVTSAGTGTGITTIGNSSPVRIGLKGGPEAGTWSYHDGGVDDLRIYKTVKTANEIGAIYAEGIGVSRP